MHPYHARRYAKAIGGAIVARDTSLATLRVL
jgi:hypothetical protein